MKCKDTNIPLTREDQLWQTCKDLGIRSNYLNPNFRFMEDELSSI